MASAVGEIGSFRPVPSMISRKMPILGLTNRRFIAASLAFTSG